MNPAVTCPPVPSRRQCNRRGVAIALLMCAASGWLSTALADASELRAGVARVDITDRRVPVNDPLYAKALALRSDATTVVLITVDAVAIGELGRIKNDFLANVRAQLEKELNIPPASVLINASHCHGLVCGEVQSRTLQAVKEAWQNMVPVKVGAGAGHEERIMENRRLMLKDGRETDVRHAYALPPDEDVVGTGPTDPQIGLLRLDRKDGRTLAAVHNFACHPILRVPSGGNSADMIGFASNKVSGDFPADRANRYLHEKARGKDDLVRLDAENRANMEAYIQNIRIMEQVTRLQANMNLLKMHQAQNVAAGKSTIDVEVVGVRVGDFVLVTFPGELTAEIGLGIKKAAPHPFTFVAGYTNGYIYYAPAVRGRNNIGYAQEDCDCLLAPEWQKLFEDKVRDILKDL